VSCDSWQEATVLPTKHRARACTYWAQREAGKPHAYGGKDWQQGKEAKDAANEIAELHKKAEGLRGAVRDVETRVRRIHLLRHLANLRTVLIKCRPSRHR
jgi:hypothetical protein